MHSSLIPVFSFYFQPFLKLLDPTFGSSIVFLSQKRNKLVKGFYAQAGTFQRTQHNRLSPANQPFNNSAQRNNGRSAFYQIALKVFVTFVNFCTLKLKASGSSRNNPSPPPAQGGMRAREVKTFLRRDDTSLRASVIW